MNLTALRGKSLDLHMHTTFSDGRNTPEEMLCAAMEKGIDVIGFSDHSYTFFDDSYCIAKDRIDEYIAEAARLSDKYAGKIGVLCGIEQDYFATAPTDRFDYVICSVHYLKIGEQYFSVDEGVENLISIADRYFGGDIYALTEAYFETVGGIAEKTADIVGHFDYIELYNENGVLFDREHPRYRAAWKAAADRLLKSGKLFEINTGGITRKHKTEAYPAKEIREYIMANGGRMLYSGDCHAASQLQKFPVF